MRLIFDFRGIKEFYISLEKYRAASFAASNNSGQNGWMVCFLFFIGIVLLVSKKYLDLFYIIVLAASPLS